METEAQRREEKRRERGRERESARATTGVLRKRRNARGWVRWRVRWRGEVEVNAWKQTRRSWRPPGLLGGEARETRLGFSV